MFRNPVSTADKGISWVTDGFVFFGKMHGHGTAQPFGERILVNRTFHGLVVLGKRTVGPTRTKNLSESFLAHDKGILAPRSPSAIRYIAIPFLGVAVPCDNGFFRGVRLAIQINGGTVVDDPTVDGPAP